MNSNLQEIRKILNEVRSQLMKKQNVVATSIGYKTVAGNMTDELSIVCSVEIKKPRTKLSEQDMVPARIQNISTDVNVTGMLRIFQEPTRRFRPAPGGISIGHKGITAGTLGCLVKKNNKLFILSNNHVLANSNEASVGDAILQPGPHDGGQLPQDQIALLSEFVQINFETGGELPPYPVGGFVASFLNAIAAAVGSNTRLKPYRIATQENKVDCAIAEPLNPQDVKNEILGIGIIAGVGEAELGMQVKKSGRTTGVTTGIIQQIDVTARVNYGANKVALFTDQVMAGAMSQGGDSGSAVLDSNNNLVGLLFAGSDTTTIINRIQNVFAGLEVSLPGELELA